MKNDVFNGCIPALMTPCDAGGKPDYTALVDTGRQLLAAGMTGVVYCGSMGDWPLLTTEQRKQGVEALVGSGIPVIVGTGAQNSRIAVDLAAHAQQCGAKGLMIIPRVLSRGTSQAAQRAHFASILEAASELPSVIYNSPYYGFETKADLFFELRHQHQNLVGFKEFGGAASLRYAAEHITSQSDDITLMVGVDTNVFHGYVNCGASGAITGIGNVLPNEVLQLVALCEQAAAGDLAARRLAEELDQAISVLASFDEGPDLVLYYKHLMVAEGHTQYEWHFNPADGLSQSQKKFAEAQLHLFKSWYAQWSQQHQVFALCA